MNRANVGKRVEKYRNRLRMSAQDLAQRIKRSQATISRIENGKQGVSIELLSKIAAILKIHPFALLSDEPMRHSVLLPVANTATGANIINLSSYMLSTGRLRSHLTLEQAASHLGISPAELSMIEFGFSRPDEDLLTRLASLYAQDLRELLAMVKLEREAPDLSKRFVLLYQAARHVRDLAMTESHDISSEQRLKLIRSILESLDSDIVAEIEEPFDSSSGTDVIEKPEESQISQTIIPPAMNQE